MSNKNKRNIVIVECKSTGINFIEDIVNRGYHPVVLNPLYANTEKGVSYKESVNEELKHINHDFDVLIEKESYEETLEMVKEWDPILIVPGNEKGVLLACKLAYDLGLKCNDPKNFDAMTQKHEMQKRIAEHGLRSIRGRVVKSLDEALEFYESEGLKQVVIKPIYGAGSYNVRICENKEEMINVLDEQLTKTNFYGDNIDRVLIQERINGEEYIVNTVTCEGYHRVTTVWKYHKKKTADGAIVYDTCETVNELNLGEAEMIEYAYDVADALGIEYGPVHGEYMIDENGPVLIEVNCRPCGGHMDARFLDRISGQHETDSILDAYLKPERFHEKLKNKYELYNYGALKFFIVPKDLIAVSAPIQNISIKLQGHMRTAMDEVDEEYKKAYFKTEDVDSTCGIVYLVHEDYGIIHDNVSYLRNVETHAFSLILEEEIDKENHNLSVDTDHIKKLLKNADKFGTGLLVTDQYLNECDILEITPDKLKDIGSEFDFIIINLNKSIVENKSDNNVKILLDSFEKVKTGGHIIIPESTYRLFPSGRKGIESLIKLLDFKIELPPYGIKDHILASKR